MRITEIQLQTHLLPELRQFYSGVLGLAEIHGSSRSFTVQAGASRIRFQRSPGGLEPYYHFAFNIPENQLSEAREWLSARTPLINQDGREVFHFDSWNADALYFFDPAGNLLELIARHNLRNAADSPFSTNSLLCVSEIGVPEDDVRLFCEHVRSQLSLQLWKGDEKSFAAMGDEEGLFIIVPIGRPWFPVSLPAEKFPLTVDIDDQRP